MIYQHAIRLLLLLLTLLLLPQHAAGESKIKEFNIGFYYDEEAVKNVRRLGGMEMHAFLCSSQFNQALLSAGIDDVWVHPAMIAELDYNAKGNTKKALVRQVAKDVPQLREDIEEYKLDFIIVFVCLEKNDGENTLGVALSTDHMPGVYNADDDHETEWEKELKGTELEGAYFEVLRTPIPLLMGKVRLSYTYRVLALDLYEALNSYTFVHELGHLFGAGHSRDQNTQRGPASPEVTPYASASYIEFEDDGEEQRYCTVMAYNDASYTDSGKQYVQLPMFSSMEPQRVGSHGEIVLGSDENNNARAIQMTASILAKNRPYTPEEDEESSDDERADEDTEDEPAMEEEEEASEAPSDTPMHLRWMGVGKE